MTEWYEEDDSDVKTKTVGNTLLALLVPNWKKVVTRSWSIWLIFLLAVIEGLQLLVPTFLADLPSVAVTSVTFVIAVAAYVARLLIQDCLHGDN